MSDSQNQQQGVYLSKQGKVFGPFTRGQVEQLKRTGEYHSYSFMWDPSVSPDWAPIHLPPAPPPKPSQVLPTRFTPSESTAQGTSGSSHHAGAHGQGHGSAAGQGHPGASATESAFQVICHNNRDAMSGVLTDPHAQGFTLLTEDAATSGTPFGRGSKVWVNLLEEQSGRSENFQAVISGMTNQDGKWAFEIAWEKPARILAEKMRSGSF